MKNDDAHASRYLLTNDLFLSRLLVKKTVNYIANYKICVTITNAKCLYFTKGFS